MVDLLLVVLMLLLSYVYSTRLQYNFDMVGYMAAVSKVKGHTQDDSLSAEVYGALKEEVTEAQFQQLTGGHGSQMRKTMFEDPQSLREMSSLYSFRVLFVYTIYLLNALGLPLTASTGVVSVCFFSLSLLLFYFGLRSFSKLPAMVLALSVFAIATLPQVQLLATLSTPDMMSNFFLLLIAFRYLKGASLAEITAYSILALSVRPDNLILTFLLLILGFSNSPIFHRLLAFFLLAASYILLVKTSNYPGWKAVFRYTFIEKMNYPLTHPIEVSIAEYLKVLLQRVKAFVSPVIIYGLLLYAYFRIGDCQMQWNRSTRLLTAITISLVVRFFLFPAMEMRYFFVYLLMFLLIAVFEGNARSQELQTSTLAD